MLSAYIDGELTGQEMLNVRGHISRCRECRDEHYSLKTMKYLLSSLPEKEPRPEWVAYLAESVARPIPTMSDRLRGHWERSWDAIAAALLKSIRESSSIKSPRLALAVTLSAMAVFAVAVPFDHPSATAPAATSGTSRASVAGWPVGLYGNGQLASTPATRPGAMQFIAIPLPVPGPVLGNAGPPVIAPAPMIGPEGPVYRNNDLTNVDDLRVVPAPPASFSGLNPSWPGARIPIAPAGGH
jgi:anti-sigma factor RsiW